MIKNILFILIMFFVIPAQANQGLTFETFACPTWPCTNSGPVLSTGTVPNINYNWGGGQILNSGKSDYVSVIFKGKITWPGQAGQQKTVTFYTANDDGIIVKINDQIIANDWSGIHPARTYNTSGSITLTAGKIYNFEYWFSEWGGGAVAQLYWDIGNGIVIVPSTAFMYNSPPSGGGDAYFSEITDTQISIYNSYIDRQSQLPSGNRIYIDQKSGSANNNIRIEQYSNNNTVQGLSGGQYAIISGLNNNVTIRQGEPTTVTGKNLLELNLVGNYNVLEINQSRALDGSAHGADTNEHITRLNVVGYNNIIKTQQTNNTQGGHFMSIDVFGIGNELTLRQMNDLTKKLFASVNGNYNTLTTQQINQGNHYLDITLNGNGNSANVTQQNSGSHRATINLTNSGGPNNLTLIQQGSTSQVYSINQNCVTSTGCAVNVTQGQ